MREATRLEIENKLMDEYLDTGHTTTMRHLSVKYGVSYGTVHRIIAGQPVSDGLYRTLGRRMGIVPPPAKAYRPYISDPGLAGVASGREIAELLAVMNEVGLDMDDVILLIRDEQRRTAVTGW